MEDRINKLQSWILVGFTAFYAIALLCNAVRAIFGKATLATHQYFFFALTVFFTLESLTEDQRATIKAGAAAVATVSLRLARKVAKTVRCTVLSLKRMPAAFAQAYRQFSAEEA